MVTFSNSFNTKAFSYPIVIRLTLNCYSCTIICICICFVMFIRIFNCDSIIFWHIIQSHSTSVVWYIYRPRIFTCFNTLNRTITVKRIWIIVINCNCCIVTWTSCTFIYNLTSRPSPIRQKETTCQRNRCQCSSHTESFHSITFSYATYCIFSNFTYYNVSIAHFTPYYFKNLVHDTHPPHKKYSYFSLKKILFAHISFCVLFN